MGRMSARQSGKHLAHSAEINARDRDADGYGSQHHKNVFGHADPCDGSYAAHKNETAQQHDCDDHGLSAADGIETRDFDDDSESDELDQKIGNDEHDSYAGYKGRQILVAILDQEEIRLRLQPVLGGPTPRPGGRMKNPITEASGR